MNIYIIRDKVTPQKEKEMLCALESYIKLAVDVKREIIAGGGMLHADCESVLLENGSKQKDIWGADWIPAFKEVRFEALINIRPKQNNRSMVIEDKKLQKQIEKIVKEKFIGK